LGIDGLATYQLGTRETRAGPVRGKKLEGVGDGDVDVKKILKRILKMWAVRLKDWIYWRVLVTRASNPLTSVSYKFLNQLRNCQFLHLEL
jgi:hypothetical protein